MAKKRKAATLDEAYEEWSKLPAKVRAADVERSYKKAGRKLRKAIKKRKPWCWKVPGKKNEYIVEVPLKEPNTAWWDVPWTTTLNGSSGAVTLKPTKGAAVDKNGYVDYGYRCGSKEGVLNKLRAMGAGSAKKKIKDAMDKMREKLSEATFGTKASCQDPADGFPYPKRETVLEEAERLTAKVKPEAYDHPAVNFSRLGKVWAAILKLDKDIPSEMVALMMACHKLVRESHKHERDNVVDACGYLRCVEKIREKEMRMP